MDGGMARPNGIGTDSPPRSRLVAEVRSPPPPPPPLPPPANVPGWMFRFIDYFVVCGLGMEVRTMEGLAGFQGSHKDGVPVSYQPDMFPLDFFPQNEHKKFKVPEGLPMVVMPTGLQFYDRGPFSEDESTLPKSYPMVISDTVGEKVYVSVVSFRDPVEDDVAQAYGIPANHYVDKCICIVSHWPFLDTFRTALEEIHRLCFSPSGCTQPLWATIEHLVTKVPLPQPGQSSVVFSVENCLLWSEAPPALSLPYVQISFQPLVQALDIDNILTLFTAVLLEKKILLRASRYELLTLIAETVSHLIYPFKWAYPYTPVLPLNKLELVEMPGSFFFGVVSSKSDVLDLPGGVMLVDLDNNEIQVSHHFLYGEAEDDIQIPPIPEPERSQMRVSLQEVIAPGLMCMDKARTRDFNSSLNRFMKPWGRAHDQEIRLIFLRFFASILCSYRHFVEKEVDPGGQVKVKFQVDPFFRKRSKDRSKALGSKAIATKEDEPLLRSLLETQSWQQFLEASGGKGPDQLPFFDRILRELEKEDIGPGPAIMEITLEQPAPPQVIMSVKPPEVKDELAPRYTHKQFPTLQRTAEQKQRRYEFLQQRQKELRTHSTKRAQSGVNMSYQEEEKGGRGSRILREQEERDAMVAAIKGKISKLWNEFLVSEEEPLSSMQYGTIYAMMEDEDGVGSTGFMEVVVDKILKQGWDGCLSTEHFVAVRELIVLSISRAAARQDMQGVLSALELSSLLYKQEGGGMKDRIIRHIGSLPVWQDYRFWSKFHETQVEFHTQFEGKVSDLVQHLLEGIAQVMAEMGLLDNEAWALLEVLSSRLSLKRQIVLRGQLAHMQSVWRSYYGLALASPQALASSRPGAHQRPSALAHHQQATQLGPGIMVGPTMQGAHSGMAGEGSGREGGGLGGFGAGQEREGGGGEYASAASRWMTTVLKATNFNPNKAQAPSSIAPGARHGGAPSEESNVRTLRGHKSAITALHAGTRSELGELGGDAEEVGYFVSGCTDGTLKLWDPSMRGNEFQATFIGHTGPIRCIGSDRSRIVSGSDDKRVLVFDKMTSKRISDLRGHEDSVVCIKVLAKTGRGSIISAGREGQVKLWDARSGGIASTLFACRRGEHLLCMDYLEHAGMLAAAGTEGICYVWDFRAGKERYQLGAVPGKEGHTNWIRTVRIVGDAVLTGSDDWTARVWTLNDGECEATIICHAAPVTCVEYVTASRGIITGSADHTVRLWDRGDGVPRCVKTFTQHSAPIVAVKAGERFVAMASADNGLSLFHRPSSSSAASGPDVARHAGGDVQGGTHGTPGRPHAPRSPLTGGSLGMSDWQFYRHMNRAPELIRHVACDVDRGRIFSGGRSGTLSLWEPPLPPSSLGSP